MCSLALRACTWGLGDMWGLVVVGIGLLWPFFCPHSTSTATWSWHVPSNHVEQAEWSAGLPRHAPTWDIYDHHSVPGFCSRYRMPLEKSLAILDEKLQGDCP